MKIKFLSLAALLLSTTVVFAVTNPIKPSAPVQSGATLGETQSAPTVAPAVTAPGQQPKIAPTPPIIRAKGYILMDANSGYILAQQNANKRMAPASLTKLMTMYVVSVALNQNHIHLTDQVPISETAWRTGGSRMFVKVNTTVPVQDLINGIVVVSGNDASVALAEFVGGNQDSFVQLMNKTADALGMKNTHFTDATGLPDPNHFSTPYDFALLTRAIINNFPEDYKWYSQKWFSYNNIKQPNRNRLLWRDTSVDGLKTGHTDDAGFCLVASAQRDGMRLIAIIMGAPSDSIRADDAEALINYGYRNFETHKLYSTNSPLTKARVYMGENRQVGLGVAQDLYITVPKGQYDQLKADVALTDSLKAPIKKGESFGKVNVSLNGQAIASVPLVALTDVAQAGIISRIGDRFALLLQHWFKT
jgi:D-alanyl-D-alanine carboxypeptidase (penicillin-binding protein 5/6)